MLRVERRWTDREQKALEVRICAGATDCIVLGTVLRCASDAEWRIRPATARPVRQLYLSQTDAEEALVEHERELWRKKRNLAQRTLVFLEHVSVDSQPQVREA